MLFDKILIANRGEVALRVMRTCRKMGIATVAIYSDADQNAFFTHYADEAICIGGHQPAESYLLQDKIIAAAQQVGAQAIHPGYGFLSENAQFARRCHTEGIAFIGPNPEAIEAMGSKIGAKKIMRERGVPTIPGYDGADQNFDTLRTEALRIGFPILLKASAGGGGKGMRIVRQESELNKAIQAAQRESEAAFGDGTLLIEKYFDSARHIEFQIFGDQHGNALHCFERECSIQRRYQKIIEESPSPILSPALRQAMGEAAVSAARAIGYDNAGTVEFIVVPDGNFYFLEVNTRLQVEHPVTEMVTGLDLVQLQIEVAQGKALSFAQADLEQRGHAIEVRLYAEDAAQQFMPATGTILCWDTGNAPTDTRYDTGVQTGSKIDIYYDPMIAKIITHADTRPNAIRKMRRVLQELALLGVTTNKDFLSAILQHPNFLAGDFNTHFLQQQFNYIAPCYTEQQQHYFALAALAYQWTQRKQARILLSELPSGWRNNDHAPQQCAYRLGDTVLSLQYRYADPQQLHVSIGNQSYTIQTFAQTPSNHIRIAINGHLLKFILVEQADKLYIHQNVLGHTMLQIVPRFCEAIEESSSSGYRAQMPGEVVKVLVQAGDAVKAGDMLLILVSMKMETSIEAHEDGVIEEVFVTERSFVEAGTILLSFSQKE